MSFSSVTAIAAETELKCTLVSDANFVLATRDSGYRTMAAAISELVDNAFQAEASCVDIFVLETREDGIRHITVGVLDDGSGMAPAMLQCALQFGGTNRFNDRSGLGRYGMGLPNSSVSQAKHFDVYSWTRANGCFHSYLDVDEISSGRLKAVPVPTQASLPYWVGAPVSPSGTLVSWSRCDRLEHRKATTIAIKLEDPLGRIYRRFLWAGKRISINGVPIGPRDPLFCSPESLSGGALCYGKPLTYEIAIPGCGIGTSSVTVRFAELPVTKWHSLSVEQKRERGIVDCAGVSVLRAGREIDYGWYFMGGKRRENYDDWWRCEVAFEPALDELFGVVHCKQGISPSRELKQILAPDLEAIAHRLNARVRRSFEQVRAHAPSRAVALADNMESLLPPFDHMATRGGQASGAYRYRIDVVPHEGSEFFSVEVVGSEIRIQVNSDHPFVTHIYLPSCNEKTGIARRAIETTILSAARARLQASSHSQSADKFISDWSDALAAFVGG